MGHAGTLDPAATGVLPVFFGRATRIIQFLADAAKTYRAEIELGITTDTYDTSGKLTQKGDPSGIDLAQLETALASFRGLIQQTPPMYSAIKHHGQPLYKLARAGIDIPRQSRPVTIYRLSLIDWQPPLVTIEVECSKGTYIRTLAHDLGQLLGCGASLKNLVRLRCGLFDIGDAVSLPQLEDAFRYGYWSRFVYPADNVLSHLRAVIVSSATEDLVRKGTSFSLQNDNNADRTVAEQDSITAPLENQCRAYTLNGRFLSVLRFNADTQQWHPKKVFT